MHNDTNGMSETLVVQYRDELFPYAYNILGTVADAQDAVQEVLLKHLSQPPAGEISNLKAYLVKSVVNLAINIKNRQQKMLRQQDVWLPEPVATDDTADHNLHLRELLSYSLLILMERLTATERAVFILKESFDYTHQEIAAVLSITEAHARKLLSRAKERLFKPAPKRSKTQAAHEQSVLEGFISAIRRRDTAHLEQVMAADIRFYADGGGKVPLAATICLGSIDVAALLQMIYHNYLTTARLEYTRINHQPAILYYRDDKLVCCQVFELHPETGMLLQINSVLDPDKLKGLEGVN
jgi:RNA polymerase sigma-70 factor (ECF subfamily)